MKSASPGPRLAIAEPTYPVDQADPIQTAAIANGRRRYDAGPADRRGLGCPILRRESGHRLQLILNPIDGEPTGTSIVRAAISGGSTHAYDRRGTAPGTVSRCFARKWLSQRRQRKTIGVGFRHANKPKNSATQHGITTTRRSRMSSGRPRLLHAPILRRARSGPPSPGSSSPPGPWDPLRRKRPLTVLGAGAPTRRRASRPPRRRARRRLAGSRARGSRCGGGA